MYATHDAGPGARRRTRGRTVGGRVVIAAWGVLIACGCGGTAANSREALVLAPEEVHYGASYGEWSVRWWQWAYEFPRTNHPLYDLTGVYADQGQVDPVWFLGGFMIPQGFPNPGPVVRTVTVPGDKALFFPLGNTVWDNTNCLLPDTTYSFSELRSFVEAAVEGYTDLFCVVDGTTVLDAPDLAGAVRFRAQAPAFSAIVPADNIWFDLCNGVPLPPRTIDPIASDGVWMMLGPLPPGDHELHFGSTSGALSQDITYHLTVTP